MNTLDPLWTVRDVMTYLRMSRSWVYARAEDGTLPSVRIGGSLRFEPQAIQLFARGEQPASNVVSLPRSR